MWLTDVLSLVAKCIHTKHLLQSAPPSPPYSSAAQIHAVFSPKDGRLVNTCSINIPRVIDAVHNRQVACPIQVILIFRTRGHFVCHCTDRLCGW